MSMRTATKTSKTFMCDPDTETMSRKALAGLQTARLKQTLASAYANVSHYKKKFDAAGVSPADFKSLSDIARFPFTLKSDLRDNYPFGMTSTRPMRGQERRAGCDTRGAWIRLRFDSRT